MRRKGCGPGSLSTCPTAARFVGGMAAVALLAGCASRPLPRAFDSGEGSGTSGWKHVMEKREPNLLIALDGTECTVSEGRFVRLERGDRVLCTWR